MRAVPAVPEERPLTLVTLPPSRTQRRLALGVVLASLVAFSIVAGPLSTFQLPRIDAFVPCYGTAIVVNDLITAVLLLNQSAISRSRATLAVASAYLFAGLMVIPWLLTFPGVFAPGGLLGAGLQSTAWLSVLRYFGFPAFIIGYALLKDADPPRGSWEGSVGATILSHVAMSTAIVCIATVLVIASDAYLPAIAIDRVHFSTFWRYLASCLIVWCAVAITLLWFRRLSVLDLWLMVALCAYAIEIYLSAFVGPARFSAAWIAARIFGFVSSILVLSVLLHEITTLYTQLLRAVLAHRREREARLLTGDTVSASIAHEIKQPLTAIAASAKAGLNWLDRVDPDPNVDRARDALRRVEAAGQSADAVIENIRAHFKVGARTHTSLDIDDVIQGALAAVRDRLRMHRVAVRADLHGLLPRITGERIQLQQVLVNLMTNAIDAMAMTNGERVLSISSEVRDSGYVMVSVEDTGNGIATDAVDRIFNPMFTTKPDGMGMGLSICRSIIEAHHGRLWVTPNHGRGAMFHFTVPIASGSAC
ncbi:Sensor protein FixL [Bradyrhizobium ivorense]|nr:Sensor protein FixL [Bradyrhizobium ivorense]